MSKLIALRTIDQITACEDSASLLESLKQCASDILGNLARMAAILRRLDELGVEVTIDHALIPYIRMIANGQLSAGCLVACAADPLLLEKAVKLPMLIQERIARDEPFDLLGSDGEERTVKPSQMGKREVNQVFKHGNARSKDEQQEYLKGSANKSAAVSQRMRANNPFEVDRSQIDGDAGPRPANSAVSVEMNWAAKKIIAAAVRWNEALKDDTDDERAQEREFEQATDALQEAVNDYLEIGAAA